MVGGALGTPGGPLGVVAGGIAGVAVGHIGGEMLRPFLVPGTRPKVLAKRKLNQDLDGSALHHQHFLEVATTTCNERIEELRSQNATHDVLVRVPGDERVFVPSRRHLIHPMDSDLVDDRQLCAYAAEIRAAYSDSSDPIVVNCSCISLAPIATMRSLASNYALQIRVDVDDLHGVQQTRTISQDPDERTDFTVIPDAPLFLAGDNKALNYRRLFPVFAEQQRVLTKRGNARGPRDVHFLERSSAEEQVRMHDGVPAASNLCPMPRVSEIDATIDYLRPGDQIILWEPLATVKGRRRDVEVAPETYQVWFELHCHKRWRAPAKRRLKACFTALFVDEWCYCFRNRSHAWSQISRDAELLKSFSRGAGLAS